MKPYQRVFSYSVLSLTTVGLLAACGGKANDGDVKIGHVAPLTGSIAHMLSLIHI